MNKTITQIGELQKYESHSVNPAGSTLIDCPAETLNSNAADLSQSRLGAQGSPGNSDLYWLACGYSTCDSLGSMAIRIPLRGFSNRFMICDVILAPDLTGGIVNIVARKKSHLVYAKFTTKAGVARAGKLVHIWVMERALGRRLLPGEKVDHINGNGLDNRSENLRLGSNGVNEINRGPRRNSRVPVANVFLGRDGRYKGRISKVFYKADFVSAREAWDAVQVYAKSKVMPVRTHGPDVMASFEATYPKTELDWLLIKMVYGSSRSRREPTFNNEHHCFQVGLANSVEVALFDVDAFEKVAKYSWHLSEGRPRAKVTTKGLRQSISTSVHMSLYLYGHLKPGPNYLLHHINNRPCDNRSVNLRWVTKEEHAKLTTKRENSRSPSLRVCQIVSSASFCGYSGTHVEQSVSLGIATMLADAIFRVNVSHVDPHFLNLPEFDLDIPRLRTIGLPRRQSQVLGAGFEGYVGVSRKAGKNGKFRAYVSVISRRTKRLITKTIGKSFVTAEAAAQAHDSRQVELYGPTSKQNFPPGIPKKALELARMPASDFNQVIANRMVEPSDVSGVPTDIRRVRRTDEFLKTASK